MTLLQLDKQIALTQVHLDALERKKAMYLEEMEKLTKWRELRCEVEEKGHVSRGRSMSFEQLSTFMNIQKNNGHDPLKVEESLDLAQGIKKTKKT